MSGKISAKPLSGFQELSPKDQIIFNEIKRTIEKTFEVGGFLAIDTPVIERWDVLNGKTSEENQKQIYKIDKSTPQGLRFDLTVPLTRYVANNLNNLPMPFNCYQIGKVYRGERAQAGRFREFYQCDIDIISPIEKINKYSSDLLLSVMSSTFSNMLKNDKIMKKTLDFYISIGQRSILNKFFIENNLSENTKKILQTIDDLRKIGEEKVKENLLSLNISEENACKIIKLIKVKNCQELRSFDWKDFSKIEKEVEELEYIIEKNKETLKLDLSITRGHDYYTGIVYEIFIKGELEKYDAFGGGGQYDNLIKMFLPNQNIAGIGISIGFSKLFSILKNEGLFKKPYLTELAILCDTEETFKSEINFYNSEFKNNRIYRGIGDIGKSLKYCKKIEAPIVLIIENNEIKVKDMLNNEQFNFESKEVAAGKINSLLSEL